MSSGQGYRVVSQGVQREQGVFNFYLDSSLLISLLLWMGIFSLDGGFLPSSFFISSLVVGNLMAWSYGRIAYYKGWWGIYTQLYFLFQISLLAGMGINYQSVAGVMLALFPTAFAAHHMLLKGRSSERRPLVDGTVLMLITLGIYTYWQEVFSYNLLFNREGVFLVSALLWGMGIVYTVDGYGIRLGKPGQSPSYRLTASENSNRLFFHDIINHTHGLLLFLEGRQEQQRGMSSTECGEMANEIELLQLQLQDHFGYHHRALAEGDNIQLFSEMTEDIEGVISKFLPSDQMEVELLFNPQINELNFDTAVLPLSIVREKSGPSGDESRRGSALHVSSLIRIITNLVKNIRDEGSSSVQFIFIDRPEGLLLISRSRLFQSDSRLDDLKTYGVKHLFPKENSDGERGLATKSGLGHESIARLCQEQGGSFDFTIDGEYWVNHIFLPDQNSSDKILDKWAA